MKKLFKNANFFRAVVATIATVLIGGILFLAVGIILSEPGKEESQFQSRFEQVEIDGPDAVYVDTATGVLYWQKWSGKSAGITVLVDKDGKPLTLESLNEKSK